MRAWAKLGVYGLGRRVLGDDEPAPRGLGCALKEIDGCGVVGQVGVVDAVAGDALARRPLAPQSRDLDEAAGKLLGLGHKDRDGLALANVYGGLGRAVLDHGRSCRSVFAPL